MTGWAGASRQKRGLVCDSGTAGAGAGRAAGRAFGRNRGREDKRGGVIAGKT